MVSRKNRRVIKYLQDTRKQIDRASSLVGTALGAVVGTVMGGPLAGAILGGVTGEVMKSTLGDFAKRWLTPKEAERIGTAAALIMTNISERQTAGHVVRADNFFTIHERMRSAAEELYEGVLLKSKEEFEEKKIFYISNIFTHTVFDQTLDAANANFILTIAERLTYRQITLIGLIGQNTDNIMGLRTTNNRPGFIDERPEALNFLIQDIRALNDYGIIRNRDRMGLSNYVDPAPGNLVLTDVGFRFFNVLGCLLLYFFLFAFFHKPHVLFCFLD